jgi:hypothetical protein
MGNIESRTVAMVASVAQKVGDVLINKQQQQQQQIQSEQQQQQQQQLSVGEMALLKEVTELEMKQPLSETDRDRLLELQQRIERIKGLTEKGHLDLDEQEELDAWHNNTYDEWSNNRVVLCLGEAATATATAQPDYQEHIPVHAARAAPQMFARLRPLDEKESHIDPAIQEELGM